MMNFEMERKEAVDQFIEDFFSKIQLPDFLALQNLKKSIGYSLLQGGKRFRPVLSLMLAEEFGVPPQRVLPFSMAVEMIHTYSLIHDDLPCMDNDDLRRGQPTNHKVFGESTALLAGDALLTEAFGILASEYADQPQIVVQLVLLLSEAAGLRGMVGGQAMDLQAKRQPLGKEYLSQMQAMKTGALIRVACEGAAVICRLNDEKKKYCREFGENLGFAFQLADDLLDSQEGKIEKGSFPDLLGLEKTKEILLQTSEASTRLLQKMGIDSGRLHNLVEYNSFRKK